MVAIRSLGAAVGLAVSLFLPGRARSDPPAAPRPPQLAPYDPRPDHPWNRLHRALFVRTGADEQESTHEVDPLLYTTSRYPLDEPAWGRALAALDEFLGRHAERLVEDPIRRAMLQRDVWAVFDHLAWVPDEWVHFRRDEEAARGLRRRLAEVIRRLALSPAEVAALPDMYARAVASRAFATEADPDHPDRPFLPPDLFREDGPWVRFGAAQARTHTNEVAARSAFHVFLRLPEGRAATLGYVDRLNLAKGQRESPPQFPVGTAVALVRRALVVDRDGKVAPTGLIEGVQLRVYREVPPGDPHEFRDPPPPQPPPQDVCEFVPSRPDLFAGRPGLRAVGRGEVFAIEAFFRRFSDPFESLPPNVADARKSTQPELETCHACHRAPGVHSVLSLGLDGSPGSKSETIGLFSPQAELESSIVVKYRRYDWGLLQGLIEGMPAPPRE